MIEIENEISYRESPRINQSFLKDVINNVTQAKVATDEMENGNVVDCLITTPHLFDERYVVMDIIFPEPQYKKTIDLVYENAVFDNLDFHRDLIIDSYRQVSENKWKDETILKNVLENGYDYWKALWSTKGRKILTRSQYHHYLKIAENIMQGKTARYFQIGADEEILFQVALFFDYYLDGEKFECKALLDMLRINHRDRTVQMIDIKTTSGSTKYWKVVAKRYRQDIQAAWYYEAIKFCYPDYTQLMPVFIVESIDYPGKPRDFVVSDIDLRTGKYGCSITKGFLILRRDIDTNTPMESEEIFKDELGFEDALRILKQSRDNGLHDYDVDYFHHCRAETPYSLNVFA